MRKLTTEQFIEKARTVHGDTYDYSSVEYRGSKIKVDIKCKKHGVFRQIPNCHISQKQGCPKCSFRGRMTTDNFIHNAKDIHGIKYDYSLSVSENNMSKVIIICREHGKFSQLVASHLSGHGCSECAKGKSIRSRTKTLSEFEKQATETHVGKYAYVNFVYVNNNTKGIINCPEHGEFYQTPKEHLRGRGCPKCATNYKLNNATFSRKASNVHDNKYSYHLTRYENNATPVVISCPYHGDFVQKPSDHLAGNGCQTCAKGGYKSDKTGFLYLLSSQEHLKIGISNQPLKRFQDLRSSTPFPFDVMDVLYSKDGYAVRCVESILHNSFENAGLKGFSGCTEWLIPRADLLECLYDTASIYGLKRVNIEDIPCL